MNNAVAVQVIVIGLGVALDEDAVQTLDNFIANGGLGSTREEACRRIICNKIGMDHASADPDNLPDEPPPGGTPVDEAARQAIADEIAALEEINPEDLTEEQRNRLAELTAPPPGPPV